VLEDVIDTANVGMVQSGGALGFFEQAFAVGSGGVGLGRHALDGDKALSVVSSAPVNLSHAAGAEPPGDGKATDGGAGESIGSSIRTDRRWGVLS